MDRMMDKLQGPHLDEFTDPVDPVLQVPEDLKRIANLFEERNAIYGSNYREVGQIMAALFPNGITLKTVDDHNRFHLFMLKIVKLTRYAKIYEEGGHEDSMEDDIVYSAMVAALDREVRKAKGLEI